MRANLPDFLTRRLAVLLMMMAVCCGATAQDDVEYRMEIGGALGVNSALTDMNSKLFGSMGVAGGGVLRFLLNPRMAIKTTLTYSKVSGDVTGVDNFYPADASTSGTEKLAYSASGGLYDLSAVYEINFLPYGYTQGYQGFHRLVPYLQLGLGVIYSDIGKSVAFSIPLGFGVKYKVGPRLNLGLEWSMHFTTSDKLDGLEAPLGITSAGFKNKDHLGLTLLTLTYDISPKCPNCNKD